MAGGVVGDTEERQREASLDASLWDEIDDVDTSEILTPPLPPPKSNAQLATASNPITITDSAPESSTLHRHQGLQLELFPSGQPSSSTSRSNQPLPPSSFDFGQAAGTNEPWSQPDMNDTQYLRDEWLIAVGQKQPDDLVDDFVSHKGVDADARKQSSRTAANGVNNALEFATASSDRAQADTTKTSTSKRGRSSLLDQLDVICSSQSQHFSSSPNANDPPIPSKRPPLESVGNLISNTSQPITVDDDDDDEAVQGDKGANRELTAMEMLEMSCSPPSQTFPHMTLIKDMPQELQNLYHRLAFGKSSSSSTSSTPPTNPGTTVRGTRGKTWQTTWQDDENDPAQSSSTTNRAQGTSPSTSSSTRGRKPATAARKPTTRGGKSRSSFAGSSNSSSSNRARSSYFASWRGRARARGRGRPRGR